MQFRDDLEQDFLLRDFNITSIADIPPTAPLETVARLKHEAFMHITELLRPHQLRLHDVAGFQHFNPLTVPHGPEAERLRYDYNNMRSTHATNHAMLNTEQLAVHDPVLAAIHHYREQLGHGPLPAAAFFVDSPGGCGKTW